MAHTVGFGKTEYKIMRRGERPIDVRIALARLRTQLQIAPDKLKKFENGSREESREVREDEYPYEAVLPRIRLKRGRTYVEMRVGQATAPTVRHKTLAGGRRLVAELDRGNRIRQVYFTDDHYDRGSWKIVEY